MRLRGFVAFVIAWMTLLLEMAWVLLCEWYYQYSPSWMRSGGSYSAGVAMISVLIGAGIVMSGVLACVAVGGSEE